MLNIPPQLIVAETRINRSGQARGGTPMATYVTTCGICGARNTALDVKANIQVPNNPTLWNTLLVCGSCGAGSVAQIRSLQTPPQPPLNFPGDLGTQGASQFVIFSVYPERSIGKAPESVPDAAAAAYVEGVENLKDGRPTSAVMMFRRALDVALKEFPSEIDAWKLEKRIDKLADAGLITKDLKQWAHKIRLEGNEAVHELQNPSKQQAEELRLFTELVLTYLFTLPEKVRANMPGDQA